MNTNSNNNDNAMIIEEKYTKNDSGNNVIKNDLFL